MSFVNMENLDSNSIFEKIGLLNHLLYNKRNRSIITC